MISHCIENLSEIRTLCERFSPKDYAHPLEILSGSSLGQHIRHILELYQAVEKSGISGKVNYDQRERNPLIETCPQTAAFEIRNLIDFLQSVPQDKPLILLGDFGKNEGSLIQIKTSLFRELAYNLEHAIHHQALIKIGLIHLDLAHLIDSDFGVAPATIRFRRSGQVLQLS